MEQKQLDWEVKEVELEDLQNQQLPGVENEKEKSDPGTVS